MSKKYVIKENEILYFQRGVGFISIPKTQPNYKEILDYLVSPNFEEKKFLELISKKKIDLSKETKGMIKELENGNAKIGDIEIPKEIVEKINELKSNGFEWKHYKKFWERCLANPKPESVKMLFKFLTHHNLTICEDGCFFAYKGIRNDFKDVHSGTFDNHPGQIVKMPREEVTYDPDRTCSQGLHCGQLGYARNWGQIVVLVKVDPANVVSVPNDCNSQKIRVCEYLVVSVYAGDKSHGTAVINKSNKVMKVHNSRSSKWTQEEEAILWKSVYNKSKIAWDTVCSKLKRTKESIRKKLLQLKKNPPVIIKEVPKTKPVKKWKPLKAKNQPKNPSKKVQKMTAKAVKNKSLSKWTDKEEKILVSACNSGKTYAEIGKLLGKSADSCRKKLKRMGLK